MPTSNHERQPLTNVWEDTGPATLPRHLAVLAHAYSKRTHSKEKLCLEWDAAINPRTTQVIEVCCSVYCFPLNLKCPSFSEHTSSSGCGPPGQQSVAQKEAACIWITRNTSRDSVRGVLFAPVRDQTEHHTKQQMQSSSFTSHFPHAPN